MEKEIEMEKGMDARVSSPSGESHGTDPAPVVNTGGTASPMPQDPAADAAAAAGQNGQDAKADDLYDREMVPEFTSRLRHNLVRMPKAIYSASGIIINGRRIKSLIFTTDIAIIRNCDADAVLAVYPFTPQPTISGAIIRSSYIPVFCGVGGGTTKGLRTVGLAKDVESQGAMGVVLNAPISNLNLRSVALSVDIPVIITVTKATTDIDARLRAGASIINVAGGANTIEIVRKIRKENKKIPIIATGGKTEESIAATIAAGANAISFTPPSTKELFSATMEKYREP